MSTHMGMADGGRGFTNFLSNRLLQEQIAKTNGIEITDNTAIRDLALRQGTSILPKIPGAEFSPMPWYKHYAPYSYNKK
jgi:hypothetical protein